MNKMKINGFNCNYQYVHKDKDFPTIVFCNGIMSAMKSWEKQIQLIDKLNYNYLLFEYRGQWFSEFSRGPYTFKMHVDDMKTLMDELNIKSGHFVGTSYGGFVMQKMAIEYPVYVESLLILTSASEMNSKSIKIIKRWKKLASLGDPKKLYLGMVPDLFSKNFKEENDTIVEDRANIMEAFASKISTFCEGQVIMHETSMKDLYGEGFTPNLGDISCPTTVVAANEDVLYPPFCSEIIADTIPHAKYFIIPGSGHALVYEKPDEINILLSGHLEWVKSL